MGEIHKKILIINKRFYLFTDIFRRPTKIETFNRLPTKLLNFNRQVPPPPPPPPPHSDPHYLVPLHKQKKLLWRYLFIYHNLMAAPATTRKKEWKHSAMRRIHKRVRDPIWGRSPENRLHNNSSIRITRVKIKPQKIF